MSLIRNAAATRVAEAHMTDLEGWGFYESHVSPALHPDAEIEPLEESFQIDPTSSGFDLGTGMFFVSGTASYTLNVRVGDLELVMGGTAQFETELDPDSYPDVFEAAAVAA